MPNLRTITSRNAPLLEFQGRKIGPSQPAFVIAEAGVNHNGSLQTAIELVHAASNAGADCIKFQTFQPDQVVTASAPKATYQLSVTDPAESQLAMLEKLELQRASYSDLINACKNDNVIFSSTPYDEDDIAFLDSLDVPFYKAASMHCAEPHFLEVMAKTGRPIILSTGMANWSEVDTAVAAIRNTGNDGLILLQCTTNYPSVVHDANLRTMVAMAERYDCLVGYSDHTQSHTACLASIALGACVIERHLTLDRTMPGPDHSSSDAPDEFQSLVRSIREVEAALGSHEKRPTEAEKRNMTGMRRSIVTRRPVPKGKILSDQDLICKRPATGILPSQWSQLIGKRAERDIPEGVQLTWEDLSE